MLDRAPAERMAHREACVTGADDDDVNGARRPAREMPIHAPCHHVLLVVTVTSVGLVMTSNTAERFCDCATSAAICSAVASASIS